MASQDPDRELDRSRSDHGGEDASPQRRKVTQKKKGRSDSKLHAPWTPFPTSETESSAAASSAQQTGASQSVDLLSSQTIGSDKIIAKAELVKTETEKDKPKEAENVIAIESSRKNKTLTATKPILTKTEHAVAQQVNTAVNKTA